MAYGSAISRRFYYAAPAGVRSFMAGLYGQRQRRDRYGAGYESALKFLRESQYWPNARLQEYQQEMTREFLSYAAAMPFYQEYWRGVADPGNLQELPVLPKAVVRARSADLRAPDLGRIPHRWAHTSGTTGSALVFPLSIPCFQREYAFRALHYEWGGVGLRERDPIAFCAGHPVVAPDTTKAPFWVYDWANNWLLLSSYHLSATNLASYVKRLEEFQPVMLSGYPSSVYLLARGYREHARRSITLKAVYTASETLLDYQRAEIEGAFGTKVYNWYGNAEMCANIVECEKGELHLKLEHSQVEILNDHDAPAGPGETGRLVCTGFGNRAFPLVRYEAGDELVVAQSQESRCGRQGILVERIIGRVDDYILTPEGRTVGRLDHIFKDSVNVVEAQIQQDAIDRVTLRMVRGAEFRKSDEESVVEEARMRLGPSIRIDCEYVNEIPRTASGKFRFVVSNLDKEPLAKEV